MIVNEHEFAILELLIKNHKLDLEAITVMLSMDPSDAGQAVSELITKKYIIQLDDIHFDITKEGTDHYKKMSKKKKIFEKKEIYNLEPAGGIMKDIEMVYEPINDREIMYNWSGKKGIAQVQESSDKKAFFKIGETKFYFIEKFLRQREFIWYIPPQEMIEKWAANKLKSKQLKEIYFKSKRISNIFFDTDTPANHTLMFIGGLQTWFAPYLPARFFIEILGQFSGGKTTVLEIMKPMCRHGHLMGSHSVAFMGRGMERLKVTFLCDEFDVFTENEPDLLALARSSQREGHYARANKDGTIESFVTKGAFYYTVHGEMDRAMSSRAMPIYTTKTSIKGMGAINLFKQKWLDELGNDWFFWYMDNALNELSKLTMVDIDTSTLKNDNQPLIDKNNNNVDIVNIINNNNNINERERERLTAFVFQLVSQLGQQEKTVGRDEELSILIALILQILLGQLTVSEISDIKTDISQLFDTKNVRNEEISETGLIGDLRAVIVNTYEKLKDESDFRTSEGEFMLPNLMFKESLADYLKKQSKFPPKPTEITAAFRDLGFKENVTRKKMKCITLEERNEGKQKTERLCNILDQKVCNIIGIKYEKR